MSLNIKQNILILLFLIDLVLVFCSSQNFSSVIIFCGFFLLLIFFIKTNKLTVLISFLLGILVVLFFYHYWTEFYGNSYYLGRKSDDWQYDEYWTKGFISKYGINVLKIPEHLNSIERGLGVLHNSKGYVAVVIFFRWISSFFDGYHTLIPRFFNIFVLVLTAHYSSLIAFYYKQSKKIKRTVFLAIFFFPVMLFNSVHVFRDTIVSFSLVAIYYQFLTKKFSIRSLLIIAICMVVLLTYRTTAFFISLIMILAIFVNPNKLYKFIPYGILFGVVTSFLMWDFIVEINRQLAMYSILNAERFGEIGSKIFALPIYLGAIPRIMFLLFVPLPSFSSFHQFYISISAVLQVFFFPFLFYGFINKNIDIRLKFTFLLLFCGVAFSTATFRHVMMYLPFGIILVTISYYEMGYKFLITKKYFFTFFLFILIFLLSIVTAILY